MIITKVTETLMQAGFVPAGKPDYTNPRGGFPPVMVRVRIGRHVDCTGAGADSRRQFNPQDHDPKYREGTGEGYIVAALFGELPMPGAVDLTYQS